MGIMVNTEDRDGSSWGMGHMGDGAQWAMGHMGKGVLWLMIKIELGTLGDGAMDDGAMGHMVNMVMCWIMYNFLNTTLICTKILLHIDIDVFYLNIL